MKELRNICLLLAAMATVVFFSCSNDDIDLPDIQTPTTYNFTRNGQTTVSFIGQTERIQMATELINAMLDFDNATAVSLLEMYRNETETGADANPFSTEELNASTRSVKSKVAASRDFFSTNTAEGSVIKADFERWINEQVTEVFSNENTLAEAGTAGQIADGSSTRYVNANGLELNQVVNKGLIGALMLDQIVNNYLSPAVLDEGDNRANNDSDVLETGQNYTTMEHKWDEAYGYLFAAASNIANPIASIGANDSFLGKYVIRVESDPDFSGVAAELFSAFSLGRAAIVAKNYTIRDTQADLIKTRLSEVMAIRSIYYLQQGKLSLELRDPDYGAAFHDLSEGFGFIYGLRFTRRFENNEPYFSKAEVDGFLNDLMGGTNGLWDVTPATLDAISEAIAAKFNFTVAVAGS